MPLPRPGSPTRWGPGRGAKSPSESSRDGPLVTRTVASGPCRAAVPGRENSDSESVGGSNKEAGSQQV